MEKTAEQLNVKYRQLMTILHSTASQLGQHTHFDPPITSKVIHIQSLRDYISIGILLSSAFLRKDNSSFALLMLSNTSQKTPKSLTTPI